VPCCMSLSNQSIGPMEHFTKAPNPCSGHPPSCASVLALTVGLAAVLVACGGAQGGSGTDLQAPVTPLPSEPPKLETFLTAWGHRAPVQEMEFSEDGQTLYAVADREIIAWNPHDAVARRKFSAPDIGPRFTGLVVDRKGDYVAMGDARNIWFWDARSGAKTRTIELPQSTLPGDNRSEISAIAAAGDSDFVIVGDTLGRILVVDIEAGNADRIYRTDKRAIRSIVANKWAVVADRSGTLAIDLTEKPVPLPSLGWLDALALDSLERVFTDAGEIAVGTEGSKIIKWGPDFATAAQAIQVGHVADLDADRKAALGLVAGREGLGLYDLQKNKKIDVDWEQVIEAHQAAVDPKGLYTAAAELNRIVVRRLKKTRDGSRGSIVGVMHHARVPQYLHFEPGTHRFLVAGNDGRPTRFDLDEPTELDPFKHVSSPIVDGALDLDTNGYYATTAEGSIVVFDYAKGRIARDLAVDPGPRPHIALSGSRMAIVSELRGLKADDARRGELAIYDLNEDTIITSLNVTDAIDVEFAPAGTRVYYAGKSGVIESWNYDNQQRKKAFDDVSSKANRLKLSPGGVQLALLGDQGVTFFNPRLQAISAARLPDAVDIAFAYDGESAVVATREHGLYSVRFQGDDRIVTEPIVTTPTRVTSLAISSDSKYLLVGESRGTVTILDLERRNTKPMATLQILDDEHWVIYTPGGAWAGNPGDRVRFDIDGEILPSGRGDIEWREDPEAVRAALR